MDQVGVRDAWESREWELVKPLRPIFPLPLDHAPLTHRQWTKDQRLPTIKVMMVCKQVRYTGRVQGVGFRYTAQQLAKSFAVAGYVRNLPGGDVELTAEGVAEQVDAFLAAIARQMAGYIGQTLVQDAAPSGYKGFHIRH